MTVQMIMYLNTTLCLKKLCQCYFVKHWPTLIIFGMQHPEENDIKHDINDLSLAHLTLMLLLHYLVKCRSRGLDVNNNEFILCTACWLRKSPGDQKIIENLLLI